MAKLWVTRGLPASGKTTRALEWLSGDPLNRVRVNRDDIRALAHNGFYSSTRTEPLTIAFRDRMIDEALCRGYDVVNDDTNLPQKTVTGLLRIAATTGSEFEVIDMTDVDPVTCAARNEERIAKGERGVPGAVIWDMHRRYLKGKTLPLPVPELADLSGALYEPYSPNINLPLAVIFDIDGTVAQMNGRSPYDYTKVSTDRPDKAVIETAELYAKAGYQVIFCSGRKSSCYLDTLDWLYTHVDIPDFKLLMREQGDDRRDAIVKYELFDKYIRPYYNVVGVYDDRNQVVEMWRKLGLKCYQVQEGNF